MEPTIVTSWAGRRSTVREILHPMWRHECEGMLEPADPAETVLPFGRGRSYGDSCLNSGGRLIATDHLDHLIKLDPDNLTVQCEAGITLGELLSVLVPKGFFLPVVPGTRHVSVGGAIANDIHGKNHHRGGSFGHHVRTIELARPDGTRICSSTRNNGLFRATIGGLGLTGLITRAEIAIRRGSEVLATDHQLFHGAKEFFSLARGSDRKYEYTVGWVDWTSESSLFGRGILLRANHAPDGESSRAEAEPPHIEVPFKPPINLVRSWAIKFYNIQHYHRIARRLSRKREHYLPFFFPLDGIAHWGRLYGRRGFYQYQCLYPPRHEKDAIGELAERMRSAKERPLLTVIKRFGAHEQIGPLSFPREGVTVCLDFANRGRSTLRMLHELDSMTLRYEGSVYPAKDARMSAETFARSFPRWRELLPHIAPRFSSDFWRRTGGSLA